MFLYLILGYDFLYMIDATTTFGLAIQTCVIVLSVIVYSVMLYIFPLQSHYENSLKETFKNAAALAIGHPFRTILMLVIQALFLVLNFIIAYDLKYLPLLVCFGVALPWYLCSMIHMPIFDKFDGKDKNIIDEELKPICEYDDEELAAMEAEKAAKAKENNEADESTSESDVKDA